MGFFKVEMGIIETGSFFVGKDVHGVTPKVAHNQFFVNFYRQ